MLRRLLQLYIGLVLYGVSTALFVHANLGADPWDVFHLGVAKQLGISFGTVIILTGAAVLLLWIPIRQMPGLGTVSNVIVLGLAADATLAVLPPLESLVARSVLLVGAIVLNAIATGMYIGAGFGPGPRDGAAERRGGEERHPECRSASSREREYRAAYAVCCVPPIQRQTSS